MKDLLMGRGANAFAVLLSSILLLISVCAAAAGYHWMAPAAYITAVLFAVFAMLLPRCLMIANQWERMVVLRLGKLQGIRGPGLFMIVPFVDTVATSVDQRIQTTAFTAERYTYPRYRARKCGCDHLLAGA